MPSRTSKRKVKPLNGFINLRVERELQDWLEAEAERREENLSAVVRRYLTAAMLQHEARRIQSDADLGLNVPGNDEAAHQARTLAAWLEDGTAKLVDHDQVVDD